MLFSQIISGVDVSVSMSCLLSVSVSMLHRLILKCLIESHNLWVSKGKETKASSTNTTHTFWFRNAKHAAGFQCQTNNSSTQQRSIKKKTTRKIQGTTSILS